MEYEKYAKELHQQLIMQKMQLRKYYDYYKGNHDILKTFKPTHNQENAPEVSNFCKLFIDSNVGYLLGNPISYQYKGAVQKDKETIVDVYNKTLGSYIQQEDTQLFKFMQIFGYAFEINYINKEGNFSVVAKNPLQLAVQRDGKKVLYGLLEKKIDKDYEYYDLFMVREKIILPLKRSKQEDKYILNGQPIKNVINNPIVYVKYNYEELSEIKDIISLQDSYNLVSTDYASEISQHRNAYLVFDNVKIDQEVIDQMKEGGVLVLPKGSVDFLTKNLDSDFILDKLDQLKELMYTVSGNVDFSNDKHLGTGTSSLALRNKLITLNNKLSLAEGYIKEGIRIRLQNLSKLLEITREYDSDLHNPNAVDVTMIRNVPTSGLEIAQTVKMLYESDLLSRETAISQLSFIDDTKSELIKIESEQEESNKKTSKTFNYNTNKEGVIQENENETK